MNAMERIVFGSWLFRIIAMLIGLGVIGLGFGILHRRGSLRSAGTLNASFQGGTLKLHGAAGVFFVVLGAVIAFVAMYKTITIQHKTMVSPDGEMIEENSFAGMQAPPDSVRARVDSAENENKTRKSGPRAQP
jgi:hypothetical protein